MKCRIRIVGSMSRHNLQLNERIKKGRIKMPESGLVMTPETFHKVFSPERVKLLRRICRNSIRNIYQLAKELDKPYEVVFRNIKYLEGIGLVKVKQKAGTKIPCSACRFSVEMGEV
ncbi:MAG: hypothetical protein R6U32_06425 [Candidatus Woesearchaeota archaeon]